MHRLLFSSFPVCFLGSIFQPLTSQKCYDVPFFIHSISFPFTLFQNNLYHCEPRCTQWNAPRSLRSGSQVWGLKAAPSLPSQFCAHGVPLNISRCATHAHIAPTLASRGPRTGVVVDHAHSRHSRTVARSCFMTLIPGACSYYAPVSQFSPSFHLRSKYNFLM